MEAGRLAKELEKAQIHMTKQQEAYESTRIEFERMSAELNRVLELLEKSEAEKEQLRHNAKVYESQGGAAHANQNNDKAGRKLEADCKQLTAERDQLVMQLEKSQEMLMNFQKELTGAEQELQRLRSENQK
jgi:chromosome segregation ATPase